MPKYYIRASYTQFITTEIEADDEEQAYEMIDELDLEDDYKQSDISDFYVHDLKEITK